MSHYARYAAGLAGPYGDRPAGTGRDPLPGRPPDEPEPPGTLYDLLRWLIWNSPGGNEAEKRGWVELVNQAERINLFGTVAKQIGAEE